MTEEQKPIKSIRFLRHVNILIWKSYKQRQRRWNLLAVETLFAAALFLVSVFVAKPVFLTPLQAEPEPPRSIEEILQLLNKKTDLCFVPNTEPYTMIMAKVSELLDLNVTGAATEDDLTNILYERAAGTPIKNPVIWVIWKEKEGNKYKVSIRSTERARHEARRIRSTHAAHALPAPDFVAVQVAISQAFLEITSDGKLVHKLKLLAMPVSPLMEKDRVLQTVSWIMLCFTMAFLPPVLDLDVLVVTETTNELKRCLRIRDVSFAAMYVGWLVYAYLTALPIILLGSVTVIFIFRWINVLFAIFFFVSYVSVMIMIALIMAMFHTNPWIACLWNTMFTLLQTLLAELLVHHQYDNIHQVLSYLMNILLPSLALVHGFNNFALLQTGHDGKGSGASDVPLSYTITLWTVLIVLYFYLLMLLQRTIGNQRAIGGQVSWKSVIFKQVEDKNALCAIQTPTGRERSNLQEVDELVAKAISFRDVSKSIMDTSVLHNVTLDIYRGEFTILFAERVQELTILTLEDLLVGLTFADSGTINVLGNDLTPGRNCTTLLYMMGYCNRSMSLIDDLTVEEHLLLYMEICLWQESKQASEEYSHIRFKRLLDECELHPVKAMYVSQLDSYYRAQLCWAVALLLEPRVIIVPYFMDDQTYKAVIKHHIMKYKKHITIVKMEFATFQLQFADRVFIFDNKILAFGGTPAYMFFKYGREYRVRMTFRSGLEEELLINEVVERAATAGATVRAHLGSLLILRLPTSPTAAVAWLMKDLTQNAAKYGMNSITISLPDPEEVCRRVITESRTVTHETHEDLSRIREEALKRISDSVQWTRDSNRYLSFSQFKSMAWKYTTFYKRNKLPLYITIIAAIVAGVFIGISLANMLIFIEQFHSKNKMLHGEVMTVEALKMKTTLIIRCDKSDIALSVAHGYVLSETNATEEEVSYMRYSALSNEESLTEYLVTRAIDSPQHYVYMYAYGLDLKMQNQTVNNETEEYLKVQALYSPLYGDGTAAARSLARVYMALMRYYSNTLDASLEVTDHPLELDLSPGMKHALLPPLFIQFLLILTISHITLIPSKEYGLIRHMQSHARNFSPAKYWISLFLCDLILYWILVGLMTIVMIVTVLVMLPFEHFQFEDLFAAPFMLLVYGLGCVPQAYLFSLGPRPALNTMTYIIVNIVFGETTIIAKLLYGRSFNYAVHFMSLSPQFNMAYAFVKIKQIFLYNSECVIFKTKNFCSMKTLHKCCSKCGIMQKCFMKQAYFDSKYGILMEVIAILSMAVIYSTLLLLWEYKLIQQMWNVVRAQLMYRQQEPDAVDPSESIGTRRVRDDVVKKMEQLNKKHLQTVDTFGEHLLVHNVSRIEDNCYMVRNVCLGLGRGEALALSGLKRQGRLQLCEILAGCKRQHKGNIWAMSNYNIKTDFHMYCREITLSCERAPLPPWMTVYEGVELLAVLRGVPADRVYHEVNTYLEALGLHTEANILIGKLEPTDKTRLNFLAAVIGAPSIIILDECTAYQKFSVKRAIYLILYNLRQRGRSILIASSSVESHAPVTNQLAIIRDGHIYDIDKVDNLVERYSRQGYTVVVHLKDEVNVRHMFARFFKDFIINDMSVVLANVQVVDKDLNYAMIFEKMEKLQEMYQQVYSYIVSAIPIDYIYNTIIANEKGKKPAVEPLPCYLLKKLRKEKIKISPKKETLERLLPFEQKYDITKLKELPWSVIFQR